MPNISTGTIPVDAEILLDVTRAETRHKHTLPVRPPRFILLHHGGPSARALVSSFTLLGLVVCFLCHFPKADGPPLAHFQRNLAIHLATFVPPVETHERAAPLAQEKVIHRGYQDSVAQASAVTVLARADVRPILTPIPLRELVSKQGMLAASFAALSLEDRLAFPQVSILVNGDWVQALAESKEKLYFATITPRSDGMVLTYSASAGQFAFEHPGSPLWRVERSETVPELERLRQAARDRLQVNPDLIQIFTWHPADFENALRALILRKIAEAGLRVSDVGPITIRFHSTATGFVLEMGPLAAAGPRA